MIMTGAAELRINIYNRYGNIVFLEKPHGCTRRFAQPEIGTDEANDVKSEGKQGRWAF